MRIPTPSEGYQPTIVDGITEVRTVEDLYMINLNLAGSYKLMNDIDLTEATAEGGDWDFGGRGWEPIGSNGTYSGDTPFTGVFDGNGFEIKGMRIEINSLPSGTSVVYVGLFAKSEGKISNLKVSGSISGSAKSDYVGAITGYNCGIIEYCSNDTYVTTTNASCVGGIVGYSSENSLITKCENTVDIYGKANGDYALYLGGIAGESSGAISECYNNGKVESVGYFYRYITSGGYVKEVYYNVNYSSGITYSTGEVKDCYNTGIIKATNSYHSGFGRSGGISSCINSGDINNCYNIGTATKAISYNDKVSNCYFLSGCGEDTSGAKALSVAQMKLKNMFNGFDFANVWFIDSNGVYSYPQLRNNAIGSYPIEQISIGDDREMDINTSKVFSVAFTPDYTTSSRTITWESSDESIASFDSNGKLTAHKKGSVTVTATSVNGKTATCTVNVLVPITDIGITSASETIARGTKKKLAYTVTPDDTTDTYSWSSSNTDVAIVDKYGTVTAKKVGTAEITLTTSRGLSDTCAVTVNSPTTAIAVSKDDISLFTGQEFTLTATMAPYDVTDTVTWTSTDPNVATVNNGKVVATGEGSATIKATAESGVYDSCVVNVESDINKTVIFLEFNDTEYDTTLKEPSVEVYYNDELLVQDTDYRVEYDNNTDAGEARVTIFSLVNDSIAEKTFTITAADISKCKIVCLTEMTYSSKPLECVQEITFNDIPLIKNIDYTAAYTNNTDAGAAGYTITGKGNFKGSISGTFTVTPKSITGLSAVVNTSKCFYDGTEKKPGVTIKDGAKILEEDKDYTLSYSNNINIGTAEVTATGKGNYTGSIKKTFTIGKKSLDDLTVSLDNTAFAYDGKEKKPVVTVADGNKVLARDVDYDVEYKNNTRWGSAIVTVTGKGDYEGNKVLDFYIALIGDVNHNGNVEILDATTLQRHLAEFLNNDGMPIIDESNEEEVKIADVDRNGIVNIQDVTTIQRFLAEFPIDVEIGIPKIKVSSITLSSTTLTLTKGQSKKLTATVEPSDAENKALKWSTSNTAVATVDQTGKVTALRVGSATIYAEAQDGSDVQGSCTVKVEGIKVSSITLSSTSLSITKGQTESLTATVAPSNADNKSLQWSSSDTAVATVDKTGNVTAVDIGTATIYAKAKDGSNIQASCTVNVEGVKVSSITLSSTTLNITKGQSATLTATVAPSNADNKSLQWSSSNTSVATIDQSGKVTAVGVGNATIYAKATDGSGKQGICSVSVTVVKVSSITLSNSSLSLTTGQSQTLTATVSPSNAENKALQWSSSKTTVATVDQNGKVTAVGSGSAIIYAKATDGSGIQGTCTVTVRGVKVSSITLSKTSLSLTTGQSQTLTATVSPSNAENKTLQWSSSKTSVATVDQNGNVTATGTGTATIYAKATDGSNVQAACSLTVTNTATSGSVGREKLNQWLEQHGTINENRIQATIDLGSGYKFSVWRSMNEKLFVFNVYKYNNNKMETAFHFTIPDNSDPPATIIGDIMNISDLYNYNYTAKFEINSRTSATTINVDSLFRGKYATDAYVKNDLDNNMRIFTNVLLQMDTTPQELGLFTEI